MRKTGAAVSRRCLPLQTIPKPKNQHPHPGRLHSELDTPTPFSRFPSAIEQNNLSFLVLPLPLASRSCWGCLTPTIPERSTKAREALSATSQPKKSSVDPVPLCFKGFRDNSLRCPGCGHEALCFKGFRGLSLPAVLQYISYQGN
jgi:hypothetical protein